MTRFLTPTYFHFCIGRVSFFVPLSYEAIQSIITLAPANEPLRGRGVNCGFSQFAEHHLIPVFITLYHEKQLGEIMPPQLTLPLSAYSTYFKHVNIHSDNKNKQARSDKVRSWKYRIPFSDDGSKS